MFNLYHRFIPAAARTMLPLFKALERKPKLLTWNQSVVKPFWDSKKALTDIALLAYPRHDEPTSLTTDAQPHSLQTLQITLLVQYYDSL